MLLKLYKREAGRTLYWEAWNDETQNGIVIHFGEVGQIGDNTTIALEEFQPPETAIQEQAAQAQEAGFKEIAQEDLFELVVSYPLSAVPKEQVEEWSFRLEEALNEVLGWTGLGHCDVSDISEQAINIFCYVVDPHLSVAPIVTEFKNANFLDNTIIAYQDANEEFVILWPAETDQIFEF